MTGYHFKPAQGDRYDAGARRPSLLHQVAVAFRAASYEQACAAMLLGCLLISALILWPFWGYIADELQLLLRSLV